MKRSAYWGILVVIFLLLMGWILFRLMNASTLSLEPGVGFRDWFWQHRSLDLAVQVLLVFAGALGIAAILPMEEEDE